MGREGTGKEESGEWGEKEQGGRSLVSGERGNREEGVC